MINAAFTVETFLEGTRTDLDRLSAYFRKGEFLLAEDASGRLIGSIYTELRPPRGYLGMLAVDPAHQRAGHGRTLMAAGEDHLRRKGSVAIDISVIAWRTECPPSTANSATSRPPSRTSIPPSASSPGYPLPRHHHVQTPLRKTGNAGCPRCLAFGHLGKPGPHLRRGFIAAKVGFTGAPFMRAFAHEWDESVILSEAHCAESKDLRLPGASFIAVSSRWVGIGSQ